MTGPPRIRLVVLMTHPVQYLSPWFRHLHAHAPSLDVTVVYATEPSPAQQGVGFGQAFAWDVPLRDGYDSMVVRPSIEGLSLDSDRFRGLDVPEAAAAVLRLEPDMVLLSGWHSITQVRAIARLRRAGVPLLYRGDTHLGTVSARWPRLSRARARLMLRRFAGYLAVGSRSREYLRAMDVPDPAIVASPHAVDNDAFRSRAAEARPRRDDIRRGYGFTAAQRVVLYAGKLTPGKRPADVIDAVGRLDDAAALIVGDGPERARLEALARDRGVHAVFTGFLHQQQIADAYVAADALLVPGRETWGLVANEALASGLPVVMSHDVGASADLVAPLVSVTVNGRGPEACAGALASVIAHRRSGAGAIEECHALIDRWSFEAATRGLVTAAAFVQRHRAAANGRAPARVVALCGNLVFAGGMERMTLEGLGALRRGGADVCVLLNRWSSRPIAELAERRDVAWDVGFYDAVLTGVFRHPAHMLSALRDIALASTHVMKVWRQRRLTHVFAADFRAVLVHAPALALCRMYGIPVVLRSGVAPTPTPCHARLWRWIIRPLVSQHIANSAFTARELRAVGIAAGRIATIANIAPSRSAGTSPSRRDPGRVAYVGQVIPEKGVLQLLDALGLLVARGRDLRLEVAGQMDGWAPDTVHAYRAAVLARADRPDLRRRVRFLGWREDIDTVLQSAAVHCCPSQPEQREGFGITVVEAKRAGLPSVVCPSGALAELIEHRRDGWVATGFDAAAIAEGLDWCSSDPLRLAELQEAARRSADRYSQERFAEHWQRVFGLPAVASAPALDGLGIESSAVERLR